MVEYYTIRIARLESPTQEQRENLEGFVKNYHAKKIDGNRSDIILDFSCPIKLIPKNLREELKGWEVKTISLNR